MMRRGFTLIEVLAMLLVLTVGMVGALGLLSFGIRTARESQLQAIGYPTARSLLFDVHPPHQPRWFNVSPTLSEGYVNGVWARRTVEDVVIRGGLTFATVTVQVYSTISGDPVITLRERLCFHDP